MVGRIERPDGEHAHRREPTAAVSVVVPSHGRLLRLRWLLNALEEQTLAPGRFEVVVVHTYDADEEARAITSHPLHARGTLTSIPVPRAEGRSSRQRNLGWRAARAPLVAFTDDDCRPDPGWLAALLATAEEHPGAVVQGATFPDPFEERIRAAPHVRTVAEPDPPGPYVQTCNVLYPRAVLEAVGGFDEAMPAPAGEDTDLWLRAEDAGAAIAGAPDARVFHCLEDYALPAAMRLAWKWQHVVPVVQRHPRIRSVLTGGVLWKTTHATLPLALLGALGARRRPALAVLAIPYLRTVRARRGPGPRGLAATVAELPGQVAVDGVEIAALLRGSVRHRTLVL